MIGLNAAVMSGCKSVGVHMLRFTMELSVKETAHLFSHFIIFSEELYFVIYCKGFLIIFYLCNSFTLNAFIDATLAFQ